MAAALASMTGFARTEGSIDGLGWAWELRSVNGRGLDLRFRLPAGWDTLEPALRDAAGKALKRGNVSANLNTTREAEKKLAPDPAALEQVLALAMALHAAHPRQPAAARRGAAGAARRAASRHRSLAGRADRGRHRRGARRLRRRPGRAGRCPPGRRRAAARHA